MLFSINNTKNHKKGKLTEAEKIGVQLKYYREAKGWSLNRLAEELHLAYQTVHHYETGKRYITPHLLFQMGAILGFRPMFLKGEIILTPHESTLTPNTLNILKNDLNGYLDHCKIQSMQDLKPMLENALQESEWGPLTIKAVFPFGALETDMPDYTLFVSSSLDHNYMLFSINPERFNQAQVILEDSEFNTFILTIQFKLNIYAQNKKDFSIPPVFMQKVVDSVLGLTKSPLRQTPPLLCFLNYLTDEIQEKGIGYKFDNLPVFDAVVSSIKPLPPEIENELFVDVKATTQEAGRWNKLKERIPNYEKYNPKFPFLMNAIQDNYYHIQRKNSDGTFTTI